MDFMHIWGHKELSHLEHPFQYFERWRGPQTSRGPGKLSPFPPLPTGLSTRTEHPQNSRSYFISTLQQASPELPLHPLDGSHMCSSMGISICQPPITAYSVNTLFILISDHAPCGCSVTRLFPESETEQQLRISNVPELRRRQRYTRS